VHNKKRKFDQKNFVSRHRRRPHDLEPLVASTSHSQPVTTAQRAVPSLPSRDAESYRDPPAADDEDPTDTSGDQQSPAGAAAAAAEDYYEPGERYVESSADDIMAGDPARMAISHRGKLVTFYRNGDPHYKVHNMITANADII